MPSSRAKWGLRMATRGSKASAKLTEHVFELPFKSPEELKLFVKVTWGVEIPDVHVCPNHATPWEAFVDAYFAQSDVAIWKASRGLGGKSFLLSVLGLTMATTLKADVNILGGSGEQSARVHEHMAALWDYPNAPKELLKGDSSITASSYVWGNKVHALAASQKSVRGPHPQRLLVDEVDEVAIELLDAALGQPMEKRGIASHTVLSSTHQYSDGTMTECLRRAREKNKEGYHWRVFEWCFRETHANGSGWLSAAQIRKKQAEMSDQMWQNEVELQEPSPESRAIMPEAVAFMFDRSRGVYDGQPGKYLEFEAPDAAGSYATGCDWAKKKDYTDILTLRTDVQPMRVVAFERQARQPWPFMISRFRYRLDRFGGVAGHDATGLGDVINDLMQDMDAGRDSILFPNSELKELFDMPAEPIMMVGRERTAMLNNYCVGVEHHEIVSPFIESVQEEHKLASVENVYGSQGNNNHCPDSMVAGAIAYKLATGAGATANKWIEHLQQKIAAQRAENPFAAPGPHLPSTLPGGVQVASTADYRPRRLLPF